MKRYRKTCLSSDARKGYFGITAVLTVIIGVLATVAAVSSNTAPWWERLLCAVILTALLPITFMVIYWLLLIFRYRVEKEGIRLFFGWIPYRKIRYEEYPTVLLTNAGRYYRGNAIFYPIEYTDAEGNRLIYPAISFLDENYPMETVHPGMCDLEMRVRNGAYFEHVGICYEEALMELLRHTNGEVYVLSDVRDAHRGMLDRMNKAFPNRLQVITEAGIRPYEA